METDDKINIVIVDDHTLFRKGLKGLIQSVDENFEVNAEYASGLELIKAMPTNPLPDIITMDMNMPGMNGFETSKWLKKNYPGIKILVISMVQEEDALIKMLRIGIKGYLSKDVEPRELRNALISISQKGFYYTDYITGKLVAKMNTSDDDGEVIFTEKEKDFIKLCCTDLGYKEIAVQLNTSIKTLDFHRANIFRKMDVKTRIGMILYAVKNDIVEPL